MNANARLTGVRGVPSRHGLTLLELVVVLTILAAVTGLIVPLLPNFVHRANIVSCTTNISEIDKMIQTYQGLYASYPDQMDNLAGSGPNGLASYVRTGADSAPYFLASFSAGTLTSDELTALNNAGITSLVNIVEKPTTTTKGDWRPTAWPYGDDASQAPTPVSITSSTQVPVLTDTGKNLMGLPNQNGEKYVIFGMNKPCTLFRNLASEPPYHFADTPSEDPNVYYMCFGAVFLVSRNPTTGTGSSATTTHQSLDGAKFVGSVAFHDFGLATADSHTKEWWEQLDADRPVR